MSEPKYLISVIIPVYGVERFIERCAISLFEQSFGDVEYIFVNDCTKDDSIRILKSVIKRYSFVETRTRIIDMPVNSGVAAAVNVGLMEANGKYVYRCDSDDYLELNFLESMKECALKNDADVVVCDYIVHEKDGMIARQKGLLSTEKSRVLSDVINCRCPWAMWNKMFKKELLYSRNFVYPELPMGEDMVVTLQVLALAEIFAYTDHTSYHYDRSNNSSLTHSRSSEHSLEMFEAACKNADIVVNFLRKEGLFWKYVREISYFLEVQKTILFEYLYDEDIYRIWRNKYRWIDYVLWTDSRYHKPEINLYYYRVFKKPKKSLS